MLVTRLELIVSGSARSAEHGNKVAPDATLRIRTKTLLLGKLVRVHILPRRFAASHEEDVVSHERCWITQGDEAEDEKRKGNWEVVDGLTETNTIAILVTKDLNHTADDPVDAEYGSGCEHGEEVAVVAFSDTVVDPHTMMIMSLNAVIAQSTMVRAGRSPNVAGSTVLDWNLHSCSAWIGRFDRSPITSRRSQA